MSETNPITSEIAYHTFDRAIEEFGKDRQLFKFYEEIGELMQAVNKWNEASERGEFNVSLRDDLIDELADVNIMMNQVAIMAKIEPSHVNKRVFFKASRLKDRLDKIRDERVKG